MSIQRSDIHSLHLISYDIIRILLLPAVVLLLSTFDHFRLHHYSTSLLLGYLAAPISLPPRHPAYPRSTLLRKKRYQRSKTITFNSQTPTMLSSSLRSLLLLPIALRAALAQTQACNNSPELCSRQYNSITHLGAHDSPFLRDDSTRWSTSGNQFYNTTVQLQAGVRLLTTQVHSENGQWRLCHSSCDLLDAGTLSSWLGEIKDFMDDNPNEVVTVLLVNSDAASASDLAAEYEAAGVDSYSYVPSSASASSTWPTLQNLIDSNTRLVSFVASLDDNAAAPYLMDEFTYIFENSYQNSQPSDFSCTPDRPGGLSSRSTGGRMALMNHFLYLDQAFGIQSPNVGNLTTTNAPGNDTGMLGLQLGRCTQEYGTQPTFVMVDFFNVGPAIEAVDSANGVTNTVGRRSVSNEVLSESDESAAGVNAALGSWSLGLIATTLVYAVCQG